MTNKVKVFFRSFLFCLAVLSLWQQNVTTKQSCGPYRAVCTIPRMPLPRVLHTCLLQSPTPLWLLRSALESWPCQRSHVVRLGQLTTGNTNLSHVVKSHAACESFIGSTRPKSHTNTRTHTLTTKRLTTWRIRNLCCRSSSAGIFCVLGTTFGRWRYVTMKTISLASSSVQKVLPIVV